MDFLDPLNDNSAEPSVCQESKPKPAPAENPAPLAEAFRTEIAKVVPGLPAATTATPPEPAPALAYAANGLWGWVLPATFFLSMVVLVVYAAPFLLTHWRLAEAQADAEATYRKRRAELKAEAEHADERLELLDKRVQLVSLGFRELVRKVAPNVVNVVNLGEPKKADLFSKRSLFFDPEQDREYLQQGVGSGIIVKPGYVLTNFHVVRKARRLRIAFASGRSLGVDTDAVAADALTDLAVIRLPADLLANVQEDIGVSTPFADSDKDVHVGDWAIAIGSPLGLKQTVTQGIVSAKGRLLPMLDLVELLQTDAAINPGNSGGPLFDQHGRIMGINVAIASDNGGNQGIGFAIPSNTAKKIFEQLKEHGEVPRGYLGIGLEEVHGERAKALGLAGGQGGVRITLLQPDQAAEKAGLHVGDVITRFNNEALPSDQAARQFRQLIVDTDPSGEISLEILRHGKKQTYQIKVGKRPADLP
jgi:S1-C subfamily serine protease